MPDYKSFEFFRQIAINSMREELPQIDPAIRQTWGSLNLIGVCTSGLAVQGSVQDLERELFPQTATGIYLAWWGGYESLPRLGEASAFGSIYQEGVLGTLIPADTQYKASNNKIYKVDQAKEIISVSGTVSLERTDDTVTAITTAIHSLATGANVTISDVSGTPNPQYYEGTFSVTVIDNNTFTYSLVGATETGASGQYSAEYANIQVTAVETGFDTNLYAGSQLNLYNVEIAGITASALVPYNGVTGGTDVEGDDPYRTRVIQSRGTIEGVFTPSQIEKAALEVPGNTRALVVTPNDTPPDEFPLPGQVAIYIFRDNDPSIIPSPAILAATKEKIIEKGAMPGQTSIADIFTLAPSLVSVDFVFSTLNPNTTTMKDAVKAQLKSFFEDNVKLSTNVTENSYLATIQNTQDTVTGEFINLFSLSAPTGDIVVATGEIASLGDVSFD